jgi:hypothetical protein
MRLTRGYHLTAISAKPRNNPASWASAPATRRLRDYAAPHADARAQLFAMGDGDPADVALMPADNRQTRGNSLQ